MMDQIRQLGDIVMVHHNPEMQTCCIGLCQEVLFGPCFRLRLFEKEHEVKEWLCCSKDCYRDLDALIQEGFEKWAGDDLIATIDNGIPDHW